MPFKNSGDQLPLILQIQVNLSKAGKQANAIIQVQHDAPVGLLLGTDVLPELGFAMLDSDPNESLLTYSLVIGGGGSAVRWFLLRHS